MLLVDWLTKPGLTLQVSTTLLETNYVGEIIFVFSKSKHQINDNVSLRAVLDSKNSIKM
jgi:hypothetical protein